MSKFVLECNEATFNTFSIPDDIEIKKRDALHPFNAPFYSIITNGENVLSVLDKIKAPEILPGTKQFSVPGVASMPPFCVHDCNAPLKECKIIDFAIKNDLGVYIYINQRRAGASNVKYYDYSINVSTLRGIKPKETSKHLLYLCYQCDCCRKKLTEQTNQQSM